jgi:hypothetical protein
MGVRLFGLVTAMPSWLRIAFTWSMRRAVRYRNCSAGAALTAFPATWRCNRGLGFVEAAVHTYVVEVHQIIGITRDQALACRYEDVVPRGAGVREDGPPPTPARGKEVGLTGPRIVLVGVERPVRVAAYKCIFR